MIERYLEFALPKPWVGLTFCRHRIGEINFLVGPNGSGKSQFAASLRDSLPNSRLLGTDRLSGMQANMGFGVFGDNFAEGYDKRWFPQFKSASASYGFGLDTFILLEERIDIRIKVEATLNNLFDRNISITWDSGRLVPRATSGKTGDSYRIDRDECHGIRELLVLLTHLYNDDYQYLIIDEPELNLHPQYQSFFIQEARSAAGNPLVDPTKKVIFLITHSPFMIDLRGMGDLSSVLSFSSSHVAPVSLGGIEGKPAQRLASLVPRLNVHHKQLFFSDNPIFVEGILDAQLLEAIQERRKVSITAAGSCIIDVGGAEEVNKYLELCRGLRKSAHFLYDLDSLFMGNLRQCIGADGEVVAFLAALGLGSDFGRYCGELDRQLTSAIKLIRDCNEYCDSVVPLKHYISSLLENNELVGKNLARARIAVLIDLATRKDDLTKIIGDPLARDIQGRLLQITSVLASKNVYVLTGGALEHYLPSYSGDRYALDDSAKRLAIEREVAYLADCCPEVDLALRYGDLFLKVAKLPGKEKVNTDLFLFKYLSDYIHELQGLILINTEWGIEHLNAHFSTIENGIGRLFHVVDFERKEIEVFSAKIQLAEPDGRVVYIDQNTNAGMRRFSVVPNTVRED